MKVNIQYEIDNNKDIFQQILINRGLSKEWLEAGEKDLLDGSKMRNFEEGRDKLLKHLEANSNIGLLVDNDFDGISSAAIMFQWIKDRYPESHLKPIFSEGKVHGIIESLIPTSCDLLIIPDASSSEIQKHKNLSIRGIDILILDHHEMEEESEYAIVINPKNKLCPYENKNLSGGGVVWKFISAMDKIDSYEYYKKYIDLAATSIIADVMSLKSIENKAIVNLGLNNVQNPYLKAYLKADNRVKDKPLNPIVVSFYFAPQINALIRMKGVEEKEELFEAIVGEIAAEPVIAKIISVKGSQDNKKTSIIPRIVMKLQQQDKEKHKVILAEAPINLPKSMNGLLAGVLCDMYKKPAILGVINDSGDFIGSARSINDSNVETFKTFCNESGLVNWAAGHESAHGISIPKENIEKFLDYMDDTLPPFEKVYTCDFSLKGDKAKMIEESTKLDNHVGCDIKELLIYEELNLIPAEFNIIGKNANTLKIEKDGITYMKFRFKADEVPNRPMSAKIIGVPNLNEWNGNITPQIIIKEMEFGELEL